MSGIDRELMYINAKMVVENVNAMGVPNLGAIMIFVDVVHGNPAIATNMPREKAQQILRELLAAMSTLPVVEETKGRIIT